MPIPIRSAALLTLVMGLAPLSGSAWAEVPTGAPVFSDPTAITNTYAPFLQGSVKVFRGRDRSERTASVETHSAATRGFTFNGQLVTCRVLEEKDFVNGSMEEISLNYLAQDDAGHVWMFGEVSFEYAEGELVGTEGDSWLVGGPSLPGDVESIATATAPVVWMPAEPEVGDSFLQDAVTGTNETLVVLETDAKVRTPAGKFVHVLKLRELDDGEDGDPAGDTPGGKAGGNKQTRWVVPGMGIVKSRERHARSDLLATSLLEQGEDGAAQD